MNTCMSIIGSISLIKSVLARCTVMMTTPHDGPEDKPPQPDYDAIQEAYVDDFDAQKRMVALMKRYPYGMPVRVDTNLWQVRTGTVLTVDSWYPTGIVLWGGVRARPNSWRYWYVNEDELSMISPVNRPYDGEHAIRKLAMEGVV